MLLSVALLLLNQMAGVPFRPGNFIGSNSALFPGQALADIYLTDFFAPAGVYFWLRADTLWLGVIGYAIKMTFGPGGNQNAVWWPAPLWLQAQMQIQLILPIVSRISVLDNIDLIYCLGSSCRCPSFSHPAPYVGVDSRICICMASTIHHTPPIPPSF